MRRVRLTENQLHKLIKESVSTILEASMNTWNHAAERAFGQGRYDLGNAFNDKFVHEYNLKYGRIPPEAFNDKFVQDYKKNYGRLPSKGGKYQFYLEGGNVDPDYVDGIRATDKDAYMNYLHKNGFNGHNSYAEENHPNNRWLRAYYRENDGPTKAYSDYQKDYGTQALDHAKYYHDIYDNYINGKYYGNKKYEDYLNDDFHPNGDYTTSYPDFDKDPTAVISMPNRKDVTDGMKALKNITTHQNIWHPGKGWYDPDGNKCDY